MMAMYHPLSPWSSSSPAAIGPVMAPPWNAAALMAL